MRVALLQAKLDAGCRAANLQGIMAAIDRAAETDPAPDLLVLPGGCDTGGAASGRGLSESAVQAAAEMIAFKAKEWGVYVAAGLHARCGEIWVPSALLFDPDGDVVAAGVHSSGGDVDRSAVPPGQWFCALGRIGVFAPCSALPSADVVWEGCEGTFIALPIALALTGKQRRVDEANAVSLRDNPAARRGAYWGVVRPAGGQEAPGEDAAATFVCGPKGKPLAAADTAGETIVFADVSLEHTVSTAEPAK